LRKDSADDYRAIVDFGVAGASVSIPTVAPLTDPIQTVADRDLWFSAVGGDTIVGVTKMTEPGAGGAIMTVRGAVDDISGDKILLNWTDLVSSTLAHEIGHLAGLFHDDDGGEAPTTMHVMRKGLDRQVGANLLTRNEADAYD